MNIPLMLSNTGSVRVVANATRPDANEIVIGDGQASVTLATNVLDSVALLFARAYDTDCKARAMRAELELLSTDPAMPGQLRESVGVLLQSLYGDANVACAAHGQYHPCGRCADEYRGKHDTGGQELACLSHPGETLPCAACTAVQVASAHARAMGWRPLTELSPAAPKDTEDDIRCVVVWVDMENPTDLDAEITKLSEIRRGVYGGERMADGWWRPLMDAPPAVEWVAEMAKQVAE